MVLLRSGDLTRLAEGLRCAVGLSLRGDRVRVVFAEGAGAALDRARGGDAAFSRPIALLAESGHELYAEAGLAAHDEVEPRGEADLTALLAEGDTSAAW